MIQLFGPPIWFFRQRERAPYKILEEFYLKDFKSLKTKMGTGYLPILCHATKTRANLIFIIFDTLLMWDDVVKVWVPSVCKDLVMSVDVLNEQCPSMISCLLFVRFVWDSFGVYGVS